MEKDVAIREWCFERAASIYFTTEHKTLSPEQSAAMVAKMAEEIEAYITKGR